MLKPVPERPRRDLVKKTARSFLLLSGQDQLPIDVDSLYRPGEYLLFDAGTAEKLAGMKIPIDFWNNDTAEAFTCSYLGKYVTLFKSSGRTSQRIRFSKAHELGHIVLNHFTEFEQPNSYSIQVSKAYQVLEREADMFAAEILAPTPVLKYLKVSNKESIQRLCDISELAAEITISDMKLDLNVSESDKNAVLRRFHRFLFTKKYNEMLSTLACPYCHASVDDTDIYCRICGNRLNRKMLFSPKEYTAPLVTRNGRLLVCASCGNTSFRGGQAECDRCGQPLYNKCKHPEHKKLLPESARYCPACGGPSSFYESGVLQEWTTDIKNIDAANSYFEKDIDGISLLPEWHYFVYEILPEINLELYFKLKDSVAILDDDDLIIFSNAGEIPVDFIRTSMKKFCDLNIVSVSIEKGEIANDI